jgi:hypothetical protein
MLFPIDRHDVNAELRYDKSAVKNTFDRNTCRKFYESL